MAQFNAIVKFMNESPLIPTFQFPDQDLFAEFFKGRWMPLPYIYNALKTLRVIHKDLWSDDDVKCIHYILTDKPWLSRPSKQNGHSAADEHHAVNLWWWEAYFGVREEFHKRGSPQIRDAWNYIEAHVA